MSAARRRIGVFGGSFNPPHLAHLALARVARDSLGLDELHWLPAGQPWQKPAVEMAQARHREAMVRLLATDEPGCVVDARELRRDGPSYTGDTVRELRAEHPGAELCLVVGQDQFARIDTWRDAAQWAPLVTWAVAARAGQSPQPPAAWPGPLLQAHPLPLPEMAISATDIRRRLANGQDVTALVGGPVARYIDQHRLYRVAPGH